MVLVNKRYPLIIIQLGIKQLSQVGFGQLRPAGVQEQLGRVEDLRGRLRVGCEQCGDDRIFRRPEIGGPGRLTAHRGRLCGSSRLSRGRFCFAFRLAKCVILAAGSSVPAKANPCEKNRGRAKECGAWKAHGFQQLLPNSFFPNLNLFLHLIRGGRAVALHGGHRTLDAENFIYRRVQFGQCRAEVVQWQVAEPHVVV